MYFIKPFDKKKKPKQNHVFTQSPSLGSITATHKLSKPKKPEKPFKRSLQRQSRLLFFNLVNAKTFWAKLIWGGRVP